MPKAELELFFVKGRAWILGDEMTMAFSPGTESCVSNDADRDSQTPTTFDKSPGATRSALLELLGAAVGAGGGAALGGGGDGGGGRGGGGGG